MQKEFKDKIIPDAVGTICLEFYYIKSDRFAVNDDTIFDYDENEHGILYHILGKMKVDREMMDEYEWKIETTQPYLGRLGIVDDTNNGSSKLKEGDPLWRNSNVISIGTRKGYWSGSYFGDCAFQDLHSFIAEKDIITINVNYIENIVTFKSKASEKIVTKNLRKEMNVIRFVAEFGGFGYNTTIKIL